MERGPVEEIEEELGVDPVTGGEGEEKGDGVGGEAVGDVGGGEEALPAAGGGGGGGEDGEDLAGERGGVIAGVGAVMGC